MKHHLQGLVRLGFLQHETVAVFNATPSEVMLKAGMDNPKADPNPEFFEQFIFNTQPNVIHLYGKPDDMKLWTNLIRRADVPAAKLNI